MPESVPENPRRRHAATFWATLALVGASVHPLSAQEKPKEAEKAAEKPAEKTTEKPKDPGRTIRGHAETVYQVAFSPDSSLLATASFDNTIRLWRVSDGGEAGVLSGHGGKVLSLAFLPDGRHLLSASEDKTIKLWSLPTAGPAPIEGHGAPVISLALSPDGKWLASGSEDGGVRIWSAAQGKEERKIDGLGAKVTAVRFSPDGQRLAAGLESGGTRVWVIVAPPPPPAPAGAAAEIVKAGEAWRYHKGTAAPPADWAKAGFDDSKWASGESGFGYSSDAAEAASIKTRLDDMAGGYLSVSIRKSFAVADPKAIEKLTLGIAYDDGFVAFLNGEEVGRANIEGSPPAHDKPAGMAIEKTDLAIDLTPHLAKLVAGNNVLAIQGHNSAATSSDFVLSPVLKAVVKPAAAPQTPAESAAKPGDELRKVDGLGSPVRAIAWSPDGKRIASALESGLVIAHAVADGAESGRIEGIPGPVRGIEFLDDATLAAGSSDKTVRVWNLSEKKEIRSLGGHQGPITALALRSDGKSKLLASASEDRTIRLWDPAEGKETRSIAAHEGPVLALAFTPDGKRILSGSADKTLKVFGADDGAAVAAFSTPAEVRAAAGTSDGLFFSGGAEKQIRQWRSSNAGAIKTLTGHGDIVHSVAVSPDGNTAASAGADKTVRIWNLADGKETRSINAHGASVYCIAFSTDGKFIVSGGYDKVVKVWNVADGAEVKKFEGHLEGIFAVAFSPDGGSVLSGSSDRTIRRWSIAEGKEIQSFAGHPGWVMDLRLVPGKPRLVSVDFGGHLIVWDVEKGQNLAQEKVPAVVNGLAISPDGRWIATANGDATASLRESPAAAR